MSEFYRDEKLVVFEGDCRAIMRELPAGSVHMMMTSPPYYGLRDYGIPPVIWGGSGVVPCNVTGHDWGDQLVRRDDAWTGKRRWQHDKGAGEMEALNGERQLSTIRGRFCQNCGAWEGQLGLEPHPALYIEHLVEVFAEVRRVLHPEGTAWLNIGDSYAADRGGTEMPAETMAGGVGGHGDDDSKRGRAVGGGLPHRQARLIGLKHKDLIGIPWMAAFALRDDGWWLRRDVVWSKPNGMPESAEDRPASSHEYVFMLTRSERYFYDRIAVLEADVAGHGSGNGFKRPERLSGNLANGRDDEWTPGSGRNRRSVWHIATRPYKGAHFAVFPPKLVETPIKASTSSKGACPECGAQWRRQVLSGPSDYELLGGHVGRDFERDDSIPHGNGRGGTTGNTRTPSGTTPSLRGATNETLGWRPGCGHGWGGDPDDLDLIASPMRGPTSEGTRDTAEGRIDGERHRGLRRERQPGEGRRIITRFEQRAYAQQLRAWDDERTTEAMGEVAEWLGRADELATWGEVGPAEDHPALDAWRHYLRTDRKGARAIPPTLFDRWIEAGWLTKVEPPDYSGAPVPVPAVVLDPFGGSGTVGVVAASLGRHAILIDVNGEYLVQQMRRNQQVGLGLGL